MILNKCDFKSRFRDFTTVVPFVRMSEDMEREYKTSFSQTFSLFFRLALFFGVMVYICLMAWDWVFVRTLFDEIWLSRIFMVVAFLGVFSLTYIRNFYKVSQLVGMVFVLLFMVNITWTQSLIEQNLETGYGMLITPGTTTSVIVFSGAEMGYGVLLLPLLLLPLGFTPFQVIFISVSAVSIINAGMAQSDLPEAFVKTINSVFVGIGLSTSVLAYIVTQQRRKTFKLEYELRAAKSLAEDASKQKSSLLAMMSHEVRNFINGIIGVTTALLSTSLSKSQNDDVMTLKYSGETLLTMLNDLLDLSKMDAGKMRIEEVDIDLHKLIHSVIDLMRSRADEKGILIKPCLHEDVPHFIRSDPTRLRQVLMNFLSNAIKFTDDGVVEIRVDLCADHGDGVRIRFRVIDTGIGLAKEAQENLFQEYTQAGESTARKYGGTGLGLSICKRIIGLLHGDIGVDSSENKGSTFWFEIPAVIVKRLCDQNVQDGVSYVSPLRILLVEDDLVIAKHTADILEKSNHKVTKAYKGEEALSYAQDALYDVIFVDYNLPDMSGVDLVSALRALTHVYDDLPIIALTAHTDDDVFTQFRLAGATDYLVKPVDKDSLLYVLEQKDSKDDDVSLNQHMSLNHNIQFLLEDFGVEYVRSMVKEFSDGISSKIIDIEDAVVRQDRDAIAAISHDITSMTGTLGLHECCAFFRNVEKRISQDNLDTIGSYIADACALYKRDIRLLEDNL